MLIHAVQEELWKELGDGTPMEGEDERQSMRLGEQKACSRGLHLGH